MQGLAPQLELLPRYGGYHLMLTVVALLLAAGVSLPLAVVLARNERLRGPVLAVVGVAQTIPGLALLALMVPVLAALGDAVAGTPFRGSGTSLFLKGAAIHITNPKAILSWGSIYAIALPADAGPALVFQCFGLLYAGSILIFVGYAFLFSSARVVAAYGRARRWFDLAFAGFFGLASFKILTARLQ